MPRSNSLVFICSNSWPPYFTKHLFSGSALYVYGVTVEQKNTTARPSSADVYFYIDNELVGNYSHIPSGSNQSNYDVSLYANNSMVHKEHTFMLQNGRESGRVSLVIFDYLIYSRSVSSFTWQNKAIHWPGICRNMTTTEPTHDIITVTSTREAFETYSSPSPGGKVSPFAPLRWVLISSEGKSTTVAESSDNSVVFGAHQLLIICLSTLLPSAAILAAIAIYWRLKHQRRPSKAIFVDATIKDVQNWQHNLPPSSMYGATASSAIETSRIDTWSTAPPSDLELIISQQRAPSSVSSSALSYWEPGQIVHPVASIDGYIPFTPHSSHSKRSSAGSGPGH